MQSRKDLSVRVSPKMKENIHSKLEYENDRTVLLRQAFREKIERDKNTDATDRDPYEAPRSLPVDSKDISVPVARDFDAEIQDCLIYGDSKAEWMREAIREYLERHPDPDVSDLDNPMEAHGD
jgi:hypothetical protein